jgi:3'-phosphoadenosine 5'-phosphosulfate (PAPS) 3'-phosphatase
MYFVHPLHPFTRRQRFVVFLCTLSFAVCFAFILMDTPLVPVVRAPPASGAVYVPLFVVMYYAVRDVSGGVQL